MKYLQGLESPRPRKRSFDQSSITKTRSIGLQRLDFYQLFSRRDLLLGNLMGTYLHKSRAIRADTSLTLCHTRDLWLSGSGYLPPFVISLLILNALRVVAHSIPTNPGWHSQICSSDRMPRKVCYRRTQEFHPTLSPKRGVSQVPAAIALSRNQ